jgi:hypothetical protein
VLVALVFVPKPRVASYQPWAMRRFLPILLPALALGAGTMLGLWLRSHRRGLRVLAVALGCLIVGLQVRSTLAARDAHYYEGSYAGAAAIAAAVPPDAYVVIDGIFADLLIQHPLWLVFGRETVVVTTGGPAWRVLLTNLARSDRPTYWIQHRWAPPPAAPGLAFSPLPSEVELTLRLPDSPPDTPPRVVVRKLVPLRIYRMMGAGVKTGSVEGAGPG